MKAPARTFRLSDWYGEDWDSKKPIDDAPWVSPWAKAHFKLRQQEIEIEQCEYMLQSAIDSENYAEAEGLKTRMERLAAMHPIRPKEANIAEALSDENFALAAIFQKDLDAIKTNLGLPKYNVGQAVTHAYREGIRGVVLDVDLNCLKGRDWVLAAGCLERGCALGYPADEITQLADWVTQPFYTVLLDLDEKEDEEAKEVAGTFKWKWPRELAAWDVNTGAALPAPLYLPEEALTHDPDDEKTPKHPQLSEYFGGYDTSPHRGRLYRPEPKLRLWQQQRTKRNQEAMRRRRAAGVGSVNPYDQMR